ncbi:MAG: uncharacterized protein QOD85_1616 [Gaiellaceae bacterium]|nr:uncharacterized protein [Gaiellaceae bacterium]
MVAQVEIETAHGLARVHLPKVVKPRALLVLGHGAGGSVEAPDLQVAARVATGLSLAVALVEQPYRVAGRRSPPPAAHLDAAWLTVLAALRRGPLRKLTLIAGGRSSGARVACRTAKESGAAAVLCLAFPLRPPRRSGGAEPPSRQSELDAVTVPLLVVQGAGDPFGVPRSRGHRTVVVVGGNHSLRGGLPALGEAVEQWLQAVLSEPSAPAASEAG